HGKQKPSNDQQNFFPKSLLSARFTVNNFFSHASLLFHFRIPLIELTKRSERFAKFIDEKLRLFPGSKVPALGKLIVMNKIRICLFCPAPGGRIKFVRKDAYGDRNGHAFSVEISFAPILPIETGAGKSGVGQPRDRDV